MALKIVWTPQALLGLEKVLAYLEESWTQREILNLEKNIQSVINHITAQPDMFPSSSSMQGVHKALVDKNNYIIYRLNTEKMTLEIINFRGTRQKPLDF